MDGDRFDDLTRTIAVATNRRSFLKGLAGGGAAGLLALVGAERAHAQASCAVDADCRGRSTCCDGRCVNTGTDGGNCGACGTVCPSGRCRQGSCQPCPSNRLACDGACIDPRSDPAHCGACGAVCPSGVCARGVCAPCPDGTEACGDQCLASCPAGFLRDAACACSCANGTPPCGGQCLDPCPDGAPRDATCQCPDPDACSPACTGGLTCCPIFGCTGDQRQLELPVATTKVAGCPGPPPP